MEPERGRAQWSRSLFSMSEYAQRVAENKIDVSVLRHLTDQDLKDIGVPLGHRRKILAAVSDLGGTTPVTTEPAAGSEPKAQDTAERRQVTVMFVCATSAPRSTPTARVIQSSAKWSRRRMRSQNVVSTQELLVGGSGGDLNRLPPRQARTAGKVGAGDSCAALSHGTHKRILSTSAGLPAEVLSESPAAVTRPGRSRIAD
jgi:SAM domain (Sterile alpha motif)